MKKSLKLILCCFAVVMLITGCGNDKKDDKKKEEKNTNTSIKDTIVKGLDIIDFSVMYEDNISSVYFTVENNSEETKTFERISCSLYDKNKELMYEFDYELGTIEPAKSIDVTYKVDIDLTKVASVEYTIE